jgi:hypothetical protein
MKKITILLLLFTVCGQISFAQKSPKQIIDEIIAQKGVNIFINIDKNLLEPNESARLSIGILVYPETIPGDETPKLEMPDEEILPPNSAVYTATNWKILQGGGNLVGIDETTQTYTAPTKIPADKTAVISVDLIPKVRNLPKVVLLQTIYFSENETAFVLNLPQMGFVNRKYISKLDGGAKVPTVDPRIAENLPPAVQKQLKKAQQQMETKSLDLDLAALSSNGVAIYDAEQGFTAIRISKLYQAIQNGKSVGNGGVEAILAFNFNGKDKGSFDIGKDKTGLGFSIPAMQNAFGCGDTQSETEKYPCDGKVTITEVEPTFIKGTVRVAVFGSPPRSKKIFRGNFYGKFKVNRAN